MARIKIKDLAKDMKISSEEMKRVKGGIDLRINPDPSSSMDYGRLPTTTNPIAPDSKEDKYNIPRSWFMG